MCYVMMVTNVTNVAADRNHVTMVPSSGGRIYRAEERSLRCREMGRDSQQSALSHGNTGHQPPSLHRVGYSGKFTA